MTRRLRTVPAALAVIAALAGCAGDRPELAGAIDMLPQQTSADPLAPTTSSASVQPGVPIATIDDVRFASLTPSVRAVITQDHVPFARANGVTLHLPAARVELVGLHESSHDGAQPIAVLDGVVRAPVLDARSRDTTATGAADIVVDPTAEIRSPVSGRVIAANTYALYCRYRDDLVFIEPDERPGWQVKVFHIDRFQVRPGQRVEAGVTVLAPRATQLPFVSQVDELTDQPAWPHVHVEVIDPSIRDRPSPGGGC